MITKVILFYFTNEMRLKFAMPSSVRSRETVTELVSAKHEGKNFKLTRIALILLFTSPKRSNFAGNLRNPYTLGDIFAENNLD